MLSNTYVMHSYNWIQSDCLVNMHILYKITTHALSLLNFRNINIYTTELIKKVQYVQIYMQIYLYADIFINTFLAGISFEKYSNTKPYILTVFFIKV